MHWLHDRRSVVAGSGDRPGDLGHQHGRRAEDDAAVAGAVVPPGSPARRSRPTITVRGAGPGIRSWRCIEGHRLTGERRYLAKADQLIRRCVHPADDIDALELLDAERRWSIHRVPAGRRQVPGLQDRARRSGRVVRVRARRCCTMRAGWRSTKSRISIAARSCEYPTETWAAQDVAEVRRVRVCRPACRSRPSAIASPSARRFFFDYSMTTLLGEKTRAFARPVVLLLSNGWMQLGRRAIRQRPRPSGAATRGSDRPSVSSRRRRSPNGACWPSAPRRPPSFWCSR